MWHNYSFKQVKLLLACVLCALRERDSETEGDRDILFEGQVQEEF